MAATREMKSLGAFAGILSVVVAGYYITAFYKNTLEIKKLQKEREQGGF